MSDIVTIEINCAVADLAAAIAEAVVGRRLAAASAAARALYRRETPSVLARPIAAATDDHRAWLLAETAGAA